MNQFYLMKKRRFLPLFITQFFGAFNDNAFKNSFLIWFTYDISIRNGLNAETMVTIAAGLFILPFFLFSATAGQVVDKYEKSQLTQKIKFIEIILMIFAVIFFHFENIYALLVILFLMGTQSTFFGPIKYSLLPEHLKDDELIGANGIIEGGTFLSILLGTMFGGFVIMTKYGIELISIFLIVFSVIGYISSKYIPLSPIGDPDLKISFNIYKDIKKMIGYAKVEYSVWLSIIGISWFWFVGATFLTQFPTYCKDIIHGNENIVTLFLTIFSLGIGVGSVLCNRLLNGNINGRLVPLGAFGITISILLFAIESILYSRSIIYYYGENSDILLNIVDLLKFSPHSYGIIISLLLMSLFSGIYVVPLYAIMQHRSDDHFLARIIAANNIVNAFFMFCSAVMILIMYHFGFNIITIISMLGILNIIIFFIIRNIVKKRLRNAA